MRQTVIQTMIQTVTLTMTQIIWKIMWTKERRNQGLISFGPPSRAEARKEEREREREGRQGKSGRNTYICTFLQGFDVEEEAARGR